MIIQRHASGMVKMMVKSSVTTSADNYRLLEKACHKLLMRDSHNCAFKLPHLPPCKDRNRMWLGGNWVQSTPVHT